MSVNMSPGNSVFGACETTTATIAASGTNSTVVDIHKAGSGTFQLPAAMTGTAITVQYSNDKTNWTAVPALSHETNPVTVAANGTYPIPCVSFSARYVRFVSGSAEASARTISIFLKG